MVTLFKHIISVLERQERKKFYFLTWMNILINIADVFSLALLLFIINFYIHPTDSFSSYLPAWLTRPRSPALIALFFLLFTIKNLAGYYISSLQFRFVYAVATRISKDELSAYFKSDYSGYVETDSAVYIRRIGQQPIEYCQYVLTGLQQIISQGVLVGLTIAGIILFKPGLFILLLLLLLPPVFFAAHFMRKKIKTVRTQTRFASEKSLQHLKEALNGYIESAIYQAGDFFKARYGQFQQELNFHLAGLQGVQSIPGRLMEIFAVLGLFILITISAFSETTAATLIIIGAFMAAAYKIIPGAVKILNAVAQVKAYEHSIPVINKAVISQSQPANETVQPIESIEVKNLNFRFTQNDVLSNLSFCMQPGDFLGISGISGKGKTTLLNLLMGFLPLETECIYINKKITDTRLRKNIRSRISYARQQPFLLHGTIQENITFSETNPDSERLAKAIQLAGLTDFIDSLPGGLDENIQENGRNISGGQQKRIALARALYKEADIYILDEPLNELDENLQMQLLKNFRQLTESGKMIMLVTHNTKNLSFCNKQIYLKKNG